jgi:hypothetical protein
MRITRWLPVMIVLATTASLRAADGPDTAPATAPVPAMARDDLLAIDKIILGPDLAGQRPDTLASAQDNIEKYFAGTSADRKGAANALALSGIDVNVLGKLCHVRMSWSPDIHGVSVIEVPGIPKPMHYVLGVPTHYDRSRPWPMVVKLMSAAEFRQPSDAAAVLKDSRDWANAELHRHDGAIVLVPIYDPKYGFGPSYPGMNAATGAMQNAMGVVNIDPARVYLVGQGEAASAAWNLALCDSLYFAAFDDFAGAAPADWERVRLIDLLNVLPVVWHDDTDKVVPIGQSTELVSALKGKKIPVVFTKTHGQGHLPDEQTIDQLYETMRNHTRPLYPEAVAIRSTRPDTLFNRADWLQVWQPMDGGSYYRVFFHGGPENMRLFSTPLTAVATCKGNKIEAQIGNVESLTFFVNDQMIDFSKPLTIEVNHRSRYSGLVTPSVQRMLADQLLIGRGWRYFSAAIDIDLLPQPKTRPTTEKN